uniref:NAC domain-containing protein n=1 Tax=Solanum lycopersicum TaxID=4081 RepID=A0A3Q7EYE9_SOLLC
MGTNINDEQLIGYLINFVTGVPVGCNEIRIVELYGNKKPSQLFDTTTTDHHYFFTELKKRGKYFNRGIAGRGGSWRKYGTNEEVVDKNRSVIGFKRRFRFEEENHIWIMKEYCLFDSKLKDLRLRGQIRHEGFVVCSIMRKGTCSSQCQVNQDLGLIQCDDLKESTMTAAKDDECSVRQEVVHTRPLLDSMDGNIPGQVGLGSNEHQETPYSVTFYEFL